MLEQNSFAAMPTKVTLCASEYDDFVSHSYNDSSQSPSRHFLFLQRIAI